jgi:hypothetical protein
VAATGGTLPYTGTGSFAQSMGFKSYTVSDVNGCTGQQGISISNGLLSTPSKPAGINGPAAVKSYQTAITYNVMNPDLTVLYAWAVPSDAIIIAGQGTPTIIVNWGSTTGSVTVSAGNVCGSSNSYSMKVSVSGGLTDDSSFMMLSATAKTLSSNNEIALIPNPVKDVATVKFFTERSEAYTIELNDVNGKRLLIQKNISLPGNNLEKLNVSNFSAGMYLVTLIDESGGRRTLKMIKE